MSKFLRSLVRSEGKSCAGKISFPREDSAIRSAEDMARKKLKAATQAEADKAKAEGRPVAVIVPEVFEHYHCNFCGGWHIGHRTNFEWIPASHFAHRMMVNKYTCVFGGAWYTSTVFSTRILTHFPGVINEVEKCVRCPRCKTDVDTRSGYDSHKWLGRKWVNPENIDPESTDSLDSLWEKIDTSVDNIA